MQEGHIQPGMHQNDTGHGKLGRRRAGVLRPEVDGRRERLTNDPSTRRFLIRETTGDVPVRHRHARRYRESRANIARRPDAR